MQIWDIPGGEFHSTRDSFLKNCECCILVFDLTDRKSFEDIESWRNEFLNILNPENPDSFPFVLIGNKCNKVYERKIDPKIIKKYYETKLNMPYFETSAKDNYNIEAAFEKAAKLALKNLKDEDEIFIPNRIELKVSNQQPVKKETIKLKNKINLLESEKSDLVKEIKELKKIENEKEEIIKSEKNAIVQLTNKIMKLENDNLYLTNEIKKYKRNENENEGIIKYLKTQLNNLHNENQLLKNKMIEKNDNKNEIIDLMKKLEKKNDEIKELKSKNIFNLKEGEKLMTIIFISVDQNIHYAVICKNTDKFCRIEELLYEKYPKYQKTDNFFLFNGKRINRFETIEENGIQNSSLITLSPYDDE